MLLALEISFFLSVLELSVSTMTCENLEQIENLVVKCDHTNIPTERHSIWCFLATSYVFDPNNTAHVHFIY